MEAGYKPSPLPLPLHESYSWICCQCGIPNFATSLFNTTTLDLTNSYSILSASISSTELSDIGSPTCASSPVQPVSRKDRQKPKSKYNPNKPSLRTVVINARSLRGKPDQLQCVLSSTDPDIVIVTETWLDASIMSSEIFPSDFTAYRKDRKTDTRGGGVLIAVNNRLMSSLENDLDTKCEIVWVKIEIAGVKTLHVGGFYRPPVMTRDGLQTLAELKKSLDLIQNTDSNVWIGGDFNMPDVKWEDYSVKGGAKNTVLHQTFLDIIQESNLEQMNIHPTRGPNILDLFLTNNSTLVQKVKVIPGISDHDIVVVDSLIKPMRAPCKPRKVYQYHKGNLDQLRNDLTAYQQDFLTKSDNMTVEEMWQDYHSTLTLLQDKHIPHKMVTNKQKLPWIDVKIQRLLRRKHRAYNRARESQSCRHWKLYRNIRQTAQKASRKAYWAYINQIVCFDEDRARKGFWNFVKRFKTDNVGISVLKSKGKTAITPEDKASMLNDQFCSVYTNEATSNIPKPPGRAYPDIDPIQVQVPGVEKLLKGLNVNKASGPDKIPARLLKETAVQSAPILSAIFQKSLDMGVLPEKWKHSNVSPIYKKEDRCLPSNYRPVSLTCISCKILEHIVNRQIRDHCDKYNILVDNQHGFRNRRSCDTQLLLTYHDLVSVVNNRGQVDMLVLDFAKAFDTVAHQRLLTKAHHFGLRGPLHSWISSFLIGRTQSVIVDGASSSEANVISGVPQGTVLGPTLFLLFINDLAAQTSSTVRLFADDCVMYQQISSQGDCQSLQHDLDSLDAWSKTWLMQFNATKCNVIRFSHAHKHIKFDYSLAGNILESTAQTTYLGIKLSEDLKWNKHVQQLAAKGNRTLGVLRRNLRHCPREVKNTAYKCILRPKVEYASAVWDPYTQINIGCTEKVQRRAARFVTNIYSRDASVTNMLTSLQWQSLEQRRAESRLNMFFRIVHGLVDVRTEDLLTSATRSTPRGHSHRYQRYKCNKDCFKYSFVPRTVIQWNNLPADIVNIDDINAFKVAISDLDLTMGGPLYCY